MDLIFCYLNGTPFANGLNLKIWKGFFVQFLPLLKTAPK